MISVRSCFHFFSTSMLNHSSIPFRKLYFQTNSRWHPKIKLNFSRHQGLNKICRVSIHTSQRHHLHPVLMFLVKFKGIKVLKGVSILAGRSGRKLYSRLPPVIQEQMSRHKIVFGCSLMILVIILYYSYVHYDTCPITGRKRWISFTRDQILVLANMDHSRLLQQYEDSLLPKDDSFYKECNGLIETIIKANSDIDLIKNINWNLNIVADDKITNAFVLPNGEIYLFTGMVKIMNDWNELAVVLSHEIAHAVLGHVQEQQSFVVFGELLIVPLLTFLWFLLEDFAAFVVYSIQNFIFPLVFEVGFNLPYSRLLEREADVIGLRMSTKACFDPRWAVMLWDKMALKEAVDDFNQGEVSEVAFLSSHPTNDERASALEENLPEMFKCRKEHDCPPLPELDPLQSAHQLRQYALNIRKRTELVEKIKAISPSSDGDKEGELSRAKLEKELASLTLQYEKMISQESLSHYLPESHHFAKQSHVGAPKGNTWTAILGIVMGNSGLDRMRHYNHSGSSNANQKVRNYYESAYF